LTEKLWNGKASRKTAKDFLKRKDVSHEKISRNAARGADGIRARFLQQ
jgi:hypothetical protein